MADHSFALQQYRSRAAIYDFQLLPFEPIRQDAIRRLHLQPGATVLDVGCGTGLSFELILQAIGPRGRIIGIEQCPEMLEQAQARVAKHGWDHVTLVNAAAESAKIPRKGDAALFHFTHDILRHDAAIRNVLRSLKPGARVVAVGLQWAQPWDWATNFFVMAAAMHSVSSLEGLEQPWSLLAEQLGGMAVTPQVMGGVYMADGAVPS